MAVADACAELLAAHRRELAALEEEWASRAAQRARDAAEVSATNTTMAFEEEVRLERCRAKSNGGQVPYPLTATQQREDREERMRSSAAHAVDAARAETASEWHRRYVQAGDECDVRLQPDPLAAHTRLAESEAAAAQRLEAATRALTLDHDKALADAHREHAASLAAERRDAEASHMEALLTAKVGKWQSCQVFCSLTHTLPPQTEWQAETERLKAEALRQQEHRLTQHFTTQLEQLRDRVVALEAEAASQAKEHAAAQQQLTQEFTRQVQHMRAQLAAQEEQAASVAKQHADALEAARKAAAEQLKPDVAAAQAEAARYKSVLEDTRNQLREAVSSHRRAEAAAYAAAGESKRLRQHLARAEAQVRVR